jgi:micrococcal nuclease
VSAVLWFVPPALACDLPEGETATVAAIEDGETLQLTDGRKVRLLGVKAPSPPLGWKGEDPWPFAAESKAALRRLASGTTVELRFDERREDRHGHVLAQVYVLRDGSGVWLQKDLVAQGFARVYSLPEASACVAELLALEAEARRERHGLWRS